MKRSLLTTFAIAAVAAATSHASAQGAPAINACSSAPPTPKGHTLVRVKDAMEVTINVGGATKYRTKLVLDKGADAKIENKDEAYLLSCGGEAILDGSFHIGEVGATSSSGLVSGGRSPASLKGAYVAIDTGYASKAPPTQGVKTGYNTSGFLTNYMPKDSESAITLGAGVGDGVFPGDAGYLIDAKGVAIPNGEFTVESSTEQASQARVKIAYATLRAAEPRTFAIKASRKKCSAPGSTFPKFAQASYGTPPAGFAYVGSKYLGEDPEPGDTATVSWEIDKGLDQGVLPGSTVWLMPQGGVNVPIVLATDVTWVSKNSAQVVIRHKPRSMRYDSARTVVSLAVCK